MDFSETLFLGLLGFSAVGTPALHHTPFRDLRSTNTPLPFDGPWHTSGGIEQAFGRLALVLILEASVFAEQSRRGA